MTTIIHVITQFINTFGGMAELADALDLGSSGATHKSSSLFTRTKNPTK